MPVAEQEVGLDECPPGRIEVEMQTIVEHDRARLSEHGKAEKNDSEPDEHKSRSSSRGERDDESRQQRQRPDKTGDLDLRACNGKEQRESRVGQRTRFGPAQKSEHR